MLTRRFWRAAGVFAAFLVAAVSIVAAQSALTSPLKTEPSSDELLAEVRGLRADFQQVARISVRAQLLVARLQLQEQRINVIAGQLTEVRRLISNHESAQAPMVEQLKRLEDESRSANISAAERKDTEEVVASLKARLAQQQKEEQQLRVQEMELSNQLTTEQAQWVDFNVRLDELERQLPAQR